MLIYLFFILYRMDLFELLYDFFLVFFGLGFILGSLGVVLFMNFIFFVFLLGLVVVCIFLFYI
ncbi:hypothetical protein E2H86_25580, partial [Pseudomonas putida]